MYQLTIENIGPAEARKMLAVPAKNRNVRKSLVEGYAHMMESGQWDSSLGEIHLGEGGAVLDGQHRLLAIIKSGVTLQGVTVKRDGAKGSCALEIPFDTGGKRTTSDLLGCSKTIAGVVNSIAKYVSYDRGVPTVGARKQAYDVFGPAVSLLPTTSSPGFATSGSRAGAAIYMMETEDEAFAIEQYRGFISCDSEVLCSSMRALLSLKTKQLAQKHRILMAFDVEAAYFLFALETPQAKWTRRAKEPESVEIRRRLRAIMEANGADMSFFRGASSSHKKEPDET